MRWSRSPAAERAPEGSAPQEAGDGAHHLAGHLVAIVLVGVHDAMTHVVVEDADGDLVERCLDRRNLSHDVNAVALLFGMTEYAHHEHHHEMPTEGRALTGVAVSATLHCLTGCAIGEVAGIAIGTALGFYDLGTIALAVALAFTFGYALTSLPLLRAGLALSVVVPIALASDTLSIATMEVVDNAILLVIPGAMDAGLGDALFCPVVALAIAFVVTVPVNRWLLARGKGHTAVHETGIHGGPETRIVGAVTIAAFVFGLIVLITS